MRLSPRSSLVLGALLAALLAATAHAATVSRGDLVILDSHQLGMPWLLVFHPDGGGTEVIARDGEVAQAVDVALTPDQRIYVVTNDSQVLRIDASDGTQTVVASGGVLASGPLAGVVAEPDGSLLVSQNVAGVGHILRLDPANGNASVLTPSLGSGQAGDLAIGAGGDLYAVVPDYPGSIATGSYGSIVRISRTSGAVLARYVSSEFRGGSQIAASRDGRVWVAHWGAMNPGYGGRLTSTDPATGQTKVEVLLPGVAAVAIDDVGHVYYQWKNTLQTGQSSLLARVVPDAILFNGVEGPMAAAGVDVALPTRLRSWGAVKVEPR